MPFSFVLIFITAAGMADHAQFATNERCQATADAMLAAAKGFHSSDVVYARCFPTGTATAERITHE